MGNTIKFTYDTEYSSCGTEYHYKARYDGKPAELIPLNCVLSKRRASLQLILSDICDCVEMLDLILVDPKSKQTAFLYKAFLITYGKCFATGVARGLTLNAKDVFKNQEKLLSAHRHLINARNKFVAHSDSLIFEQSEVYLSKFGGNLDIFVPSNKYGHPTDHSFKEVQDHTLFVYEHVSIVIGKLELRLLNEYA